MKHETKLWRIIKKNTPSIRWNRIENAINSGMPDLLGSLENSNFFTVELKITYDNKTVRFSPHQIAWHKINHGKKFIMISARCPLSVKLFEHTIIKGQRTKINGHKPLAVVNDLKDDEQWLNVEYQLRLKT